MNKAYLTNLIAFILLLVGYLSRQSQLLAIGSYALSGALTNHIAIHMLFEKVPGLYGSGVIQLRFEEFKQSIKQLMMTEFFNSQQVNQFIEAASSEKIADFHTSELVEKINFDHVFEQLSTAILASQLGQMLNMFGGQEMLNSFKPQLIESLQSALSSDDIDEEVKQVVLKHLHEHQQLSPDLIENMIDNRLQQLTAQAVKKMIQDIIQQHLGWLVVWGGLFGGGIGLITSYIS